MDWTGCKLQTSRLDWIGLGLAHRGVDMGVRESEPIFGYGSALVRVIAKEPQAPSPKQVL